jgi:hypothetical protein
MTHQGSLSTHHLGGGSGSRLRGIEILADAQVVI